MKILFVCDPTTISNPYVHTLVEGMRELHVEATMSCEKLWISNNYDIIHFQWPEAIYKWQRHISQEQVSLLKERIAILKKEGKRIVLTCHNLQPHTNKDKGVNALYPVIYELTDLFVHMGTYSHELLYKQYPNAQHVIIPHHIYNHTYHFKGKKEACQKELGIDCSKVNILCFGEFRTNEERAFIIHLRDRISHEGIEFLTPGFYRKHWYTKSLRESIRRIREINKYKNLGLRFYTTPISDDMAEKYFTACDIVLLQRLRILNSGNLPMGFYAGKVVVGVDEGNVGSILQETGNPTFKADNLETAVKAIHKAIHLTEAGLGEKNRLLAEHEWSTETVVNKLIRAYANLK